MFYLNWWLIILGIILTMFSDFVISSVSLAITGEEKAEQGKRRLSFRDILCINILGPSTEELFYRAPICVLAYATGGFCPLVWAAIILWSGLHFGYQHYFIGDEDWEVPPNTAYRICNVISAVFFGLLAGWVAVTASFFSALVMHCLRNMVSTCIMFFYPQMGE